MYTELKTYQFIISMLKKYGIKNMILSAGSRNVPFVHSVEKDSYFNCYSVVDERSAGYFALGMAQETNEPVLISCTASTASCNYYPPVAEAYYQNVPMIILTSDRDPRMLGQREDQMIDQVNMFDRHVKKSVNLPLINCKADEEYCIRLINEAFLELNHNGECGPIHINVPMDSYNKSFTAKSLPDVNVIKRIAVNEKDKWKEKADALLDSRKVMVVCGQKSFIPKGLNKALEEARNAKVIGKSLEAKVKLFAGGELLAFLQENVDNLPAAFIVSQVELAQGEGDYKGEVDGLSISIEKAQGEKCARCWSYSESVGTHAAHPEICDRCAKILGE